MLERSEKMRTIRGYPLLKLTDNGSIIISTMAVNKSTTDPIAGKLLVNMISDLLK